MRRKIYSYNLHNRFSRGAKFTETANHLMQKTIEYTEPRFLRGKKGVRIYEENILGIFKARRSPSGRAARRARRVGPISARNVLWARKVEYAKLIYYALVRRPARAATFPSRSNTVTVAHTHTRRHSKLLHHRVRHAHVPRAHHADENPLISRPITMAEEYLYGKYDRPRCRDHRPLVI